MRTLGVHHVSINVNDVPKALEFYVEVLGLTQRPDRPDFGFGGAWLDCGGQQVHLIEGRVPDDVGQHFAVRVEDVAATINELRERGVQVSDPIPVGTTKALQAFLRDPCGNSIELHQPAPAA
jgi:catechol 2,3-dioxygenase-like lactoylglutathione lyase family enzyme